MNIELNKKNIILLIILCLLLLGSAIIIYLKDSKPNSANSTSVNNKEIVTNYSNFYTVSSCVYRYLTYLHAKDTNSLLKILDEDFLKSNSINENNIYNFLPSYEGNISFNARKMYTEKISNNINLYYVFGYVEKDIIDSLPEQIEAYYLVKLDVKNNLFTIMPYSGEIFK